MYSKIKIIKICNKKNIHICEKFFTGKLVGLEITNSTGFPVLQTLPPTENNVKRKFIKESFYKSLQLQNKSSTLVSL